MSDKKITLRLSVDEARTAHAVISRFRDDRERSRVHCPCRTKGADVCCRDMAELRAIEKALDDALWAQNDRAWIRGLHAKYGLKCKGTDCGCQS